MTQFPAPFGPERTQGTARSLQERVRRLETRTAGIDSGFPLMPLPGVIDPAYSSGDPMVLVNGSVTLTGPYQYVTSYTPTASDTVILLPVPALQSYVVLGKPA